MSWHEDFEGTEQQFDDYVGIWHDTNCGTEVQFTQWKGTNWYVCDKGIHTYWTDWQRFWCRPFMACHQR